MSKFKVGDSVTVDGQVARIVWLRENASEIDAMDEYIVEFEDKRRRFLMAGEVGLGQHLERVEYREGHRQSR
jgi:beta-lactamase superfamily II metal-dependent hydrolase